MMSPIEQEALDRRIENLKKHVTIFDVLRLHGVELYGDHEHQISCPYPENHRHGDTKKSCRVYEDGWIYCYACMDKQQDIIRMTMQKQGCTFFQAIWRLERQFNVPTGHLDIPINLVKKLNEILESGNFKDEEPEYKKRFRQGETLLRAGRKKLSLSQYTSLYGVMDDLKWDADEGRLTGEELNKHSTKWLEKVTSLVNGG